jgi:tetratricopeptide (TPR) repeat protein
MKLWLLIFEFYLKMGKKELADESIQEAQQIYPRHHYVFYAQGLRKEFEVDQPSRDEDVTGSNSSHREEAIQEAKQDYLKSLAISPRSIETRHKLAALLCEEGSLEMAEKLLRECLQVDPYHDKSWQLLGGVLQRRGDTEQACHSLMTACKLELTSPIKPFSSLLFWTF